MEGCAINKSGHNLRWLFWVLKFSIQILNSRGSNGEKNHCGLPSILLVYYFWIDETKGIRSKRAVVVVGLDFCLTFHSHASIYKSCMTVVASGVLSV